MNINICLSLDNNYAKYCAVTMASILRNSSTEEQLNFYILDDGLTDDSHEKLLKLKQIKDFNIEFIKINREDFANCLNVKTHGYISLATYYRLKIASLLPTEVEKVIYLDCDIIVRKSLKGLFETEMENYYIAGVADTDEKRQLRKLKMDASGYHFNGGVLLINCELWRQENIEERLFDYVNKNSEHIYLGDQQVLNVTLQDKMKRLPSVWNVQVSNFTNRSDYTRDPYIIHYISARKPWHFASSQYFKKEYFKYLQSTDWALTTKSEKFKYYVTSEVWSYFKYFCRRPLFLLRKRFWQAFIHTYILTTEVQ